MENVGTYGKFMEYMGRHGQNLLDGIYHEYLWKIWEYMGRSWDFMWGFNGIELIER